MKERGVSHIVKTIGYDAGEGHRATDKKENTLGKGLHETYFYPLIEWRWQRAECVEAIARHGLKPPGKSSCFFCPAMKLGEVIKLRQEHPEHFRRALALEENLKVKGRVEGLHFGVRWSEIVQADDKQLKLFDWLDQNSPATVPCGCYDG